MCLDIIIWHTANRCGRYLFEKGHFTDAMVMADQATSICQKALVKNAHPGFSEWVVRDIISHLGNVRASIFYETGETRQALELHLKIKADRETNRRFGNVEDEKWIAAARGNIAVSLMAEGKPDEALPVILDLVQRADMKPNEDTYLNNMCICLYMLGRYDEALEYNRKAVEAVKTLRGKESAQMAV